MALTFNGQSMHSHITVVQQESDEPGDNDAVTVENPYVINSVYRPKVVVQTTSDLNDAENVAKNIRAQELKGMKLVINIDRWVINGKIIKPGMVVSVTNPEVYLFKKSNWFVEEVAFTGDNIKQTAVITCVLPEVYNGQDPVYLFEGIDLK
jgi:hypothetical protein